MSILSMSTYMQIYEQITPKLLLFNNAKYYKSLQWKVHPPSHLDFTIGAFHQDMLGSPAVPASCAL